MKSVGCKDSMLLWNYLIIVTMLSQYNLSVNTKIVVKPIDLRHIKLIS